MAARGYRNFYAVTVVHVTGLGFVYEYGRFERISFESFGTIEINRRLLIGNGRRRRLGRRLSRCQDRATRRRCFAWLRTLRECDTREDQQEQRCHREFHLPSPFFRWP